MNDAAADAINDKLYEYYQQSSAPSMCPTQFNYSNCNDNKWIERLVSNPMIPELLFSVLNDQNMNLKKENEVIKRVQDENQKLTRMWTTLQNPGMIEQTTMDDFLGTTSSGQPQPQPQPQPQQQSKGFFSWFGKGGGGFDFDKLSTPQQMQPAGCPVYSKKLDFNECSDVNTIVDFLLNDARISQYLMNYDETNALIENKALKIENETLKRRYPNWNQLMEDNRKLAIQINKAHRIAGTQSPLKIHWKMSYGEGNEYYISTTGGKKARKTAKKSKRSKSRSKRSSKAVR